MMQFCIVMDSAENAHAHNYLPSRLFFQVCSVFLILLASSVGFHFRIVQFRFICYNKLKDQLKRRNETCRMSENGNASKLCSGWL